MKILIVGAGGFLGRHLAGRLAAHGHLIVAAGRNPDRLAWMLPGTETVRCDLETDTSADWASRLAGVDVVINCAGLIRDSGGRYAAVHDRGAVALFDACFATGVGRVLQVSALGAEAGAITLYHQTKRAADDYLAGLDPTGARIDWAVLRPSLIVGRGGQSTALFASLAALPMPLRLGPGHWALQPIHVDDLVTAITALIDRPGPIAARIDMVGPEAMTTDAVTSAFRRWLGLAPARSLPVPAWAIGVAARIGETIGLGAVTRESVTMLRAGNVGDAGPMVAACGVRPASLELALARNPSVAADLSAARMAPVRHLLRGLLAVVWLAGGLIPLLLTPRPQSIALLRTVGITGGAAPVTLVGASLIDIAIGLALALRIRVRPVAAASLVVMVGYSAILALCIPSLWADPFGPLVKNLAVLGLALAVYATEADHG